MKQTKPNEVKISCSKAVLNTIPTPDAGDFAAGVNDPQPPPTPGGWLPWAAGGLGLLIGLLLPAVQKLMNTPKGPQEAKKIFIGGLSAAPNNPDPSPQTREHILLNHEPQKTSVQFPYQARQHDGGTAIGDANGDGDVDLGDLKNTSSNSDGAGRDDVITREDKDKG